MNKTTSKNNTGYLFLTLSAMAFIAFLGMYNSDQSTLTGLFLIIGFVSLSIAVRWFPLFKGFSYSLLIFSAVCVSMYFPEYFLGIGNFKFSLLIVPLLQIIMFGMGSQMSLNDFVGVIKMPKGVIAGVICQFTIMPIIGITVAKLFNFPPEIGAGIVLVGSCPSGMASNVMAFLAKANLALSVTLTAFATLLSPIMTPLLMQTFAGELIEIDFWDMMLGIFNMVILPICAGLIFNLFLNGNKSRKSIIIEIAAYVSIIFLKNLLQSTSEGISQTQIVSTIIKDLLIFGLLPVIAAYAFKLTANGRKDKLEKILSFISMLAIGIIITVITAAGRDSLLEVGLLLIIACLIQNMFGYSLGYFIAKLLRLKEKDCRTIALEVGMQNGGLASGLAIQMGKIATVGLAPAIFGPMMNITGSSLATWWRSKSTE
ncbi:bile acid:sodium symporter family protein [Algibacter mikhailovii]|nr:bile acid:sodium symporter family protein [Algibacter mikhailovii]